MPTNYDEIAEQYKRSKQVAWRYYVEQYSLCALAGDLTGVSVLDLACGDGHYTRLFKRMGASRVVGVDISTRMIELANAAEKGERLGIEYLVGDACSVHLEASVDVVLAAYLLNYARSGQDLLAMAKAIHRGLKPGGRFVTVNNNPNQQLRSFENTRKYGFVKSRGGTSKWRRDSLHVYAGWRGIRHRKLLSGCRDTCIRFPECRLLGCALACSAIGANRIRSTRRVLGRFS
jgi:toxoflavin synthase